MWKLKTFFCYFVMLIVVNVAINILKLASLNFSDEEILVGELCKYSVILYRVMLRVQFL